MFLPTQFMLELVCGFAEIVLQVNYNSKALNWYYTGTSTFAHYRQT